MSTDAIDLLAATAQRWRYPGLAAALAGDDRPDLAQAMALLLADIARPSTPQDSLTGMIRDGKFDTADDLLLELLEHRVDGVDPEQVAAELDAARAAATADVSRAWAELDIRAAALGIAARDITEVLELAASSRLDAQSLVRRRADDIAAAEQRRRAELTARLAERLAEVPPGAGSDPWTEAVAQSVRLGEFGIAAKLLDAGYENWLDEGPLTVLPVPWHWPWRDRGVTDVLGWYADRWASPGTEFARYRPPASDLAAARLVAALGAVAVRRDLDVVAELTGSLAQLVDAAGTDPYSAGDGLAVDMAGLDDERRLASIAPFTRQMTLWIGTDPLDGRPPRSSGGPPVVWFQPIMTAEPTERGDVAVLDVSTLLRLLAPGPGGRAVDAPTRRINLLRLLIRQLDQGPLLAGGVRFVGELSPRDQLAWLLDVFGVAPDAPVLDGLLHEFGTQSGALGCMVDALVTVARQGDQRVTATDLTRVSRQFGASISAAALAPLAPQVLARATLWLILAHFDADRSCTIDDILEEFGRFDLPKRVATRLINRDGVTAALRTLADEGLLRPAGDRVGFPAPGLAAALRDTPDGPLASASLAESLAELTLAVQQADDAAAATMGPRITHLIGHRVDNDVISILGRLERCATRVAEVEVRAELDEVRRRIQSLGGGTYLRLYYEALTPPEPVEVVELVGTLIGSVEWHLPPGVRITQSDGPHCWVRANPTLLEESLRNLVVNSARMLTPPSWSEYRGIEISVRAVDASTARTVALTGDAVVIEVADSGPGFSAEQLAHARAVTGATGQRWRSLNTGGQGLPLTASLLLDYGGALEIDNGSGRLAGGCVRVWLPRSDERTRP